MEEESIPRFQSVAAALRFHFRARELLADLDRRMLRSHGLRNAGCSATSGAIADFLRVGSCMRGLDEFQLWLMAELYGPTCFAARQRSLSRACAEARRRYPGRCFTLRSIARVKQSSLSLVRRRLEALGLIAPPPRGARAGRLIQNTLHARLETARRRH
ncbi:MAG TPA: hypothetical protein VEC38_05295 [Candidatus Binataceae bacterium]|nr:hypothetical protein [Candidatus Binataceae bacterium]